MDLPKERVFTQLCYLNWCGVTQCVFTAVIPQRLRQNVSLSEDNANNGKRHRHFARQFSVPRTVKRWRDLPLSDRQTGADLQHRQHPPLGLGWTRLSLAGLGWAACLLPLSRSCIRVCHSSEQLCWASAPAFGCAESCGSTAPSQGCPTLSWFRLTGEPSTSITHLPPHPGQPKRLGRDTPPLVTPYLVVLGPTRYAVCWRRTQLLG